MKPLHKPIVIAPMAGGRFGGGPSTPELVAAAAQHGVFGFLAGDYLIPAHLLAQIERVDELLSGEFGAEKGSGYGINLLVLKRHEYSSEKADVG